MQMNVSVTPELYELVTRKVNSGLYGNASEVVRDTLRRMNERVIVDTAWGELNDTLEASADSGRSSRSVSDVISQTHCGADIEVLRFLHGRSDVISKLSAYL